MQILKINDLCKKYDDKLVLNDVSFSIDKGDVVSVIGPSGSGKSTLLRTIFNLTKAEKGSIKFLDDYIMNNGVYNKNKKLKEIYQKLGMIFQDFNLFDNLNVIDNIMIAPKIVQKKDKNEVLNYAKELLKMVNLEDKELSYPSMLSGGQKQRIAIARALAMKPELILLDEPTSALDVEAIDELVKTINKMKEKGITMLIVTHDISFAKAVSSRLIMLDCGKIIMDKYVSEIDTINDERIEKFLKKRD